MFLLRADREALARHADKIDDELRSGALDLAHDGAKLFAARVAVVEKLVAALLAAPFDHTNEEFIELDPKKLELAATEDELRERWRRRLELEVLERVAQMEARLEPKKPAPGKRGKAAAEADADDDADDTAMMPVSRDPDDPGGARGEGPRGPREDVRRPVRAAANARPARRRRGRRQRGRDRARSRTPRTCRPPTRRTSTSR